MVLLLAVCVFAPGFFFVRRLRWSALEKLCGSVALSLMFLWLAGWGLYVAGAPVAAGYAVSAVCLGMGLASLGDLRRLFRIKRTRNAVLGFAFLFGWTLLALCIIRVYNGASWTGDWLEHFQRSLFFAQHFPKDTPIFGNYLLPARPPAENVLAGLFLNQIADRFELFQVVFAFLNLLVFLPCCLALPMLARSRRYGVVPLVGLFAASPIVMQNATYTWTKLLTAFFVVSAIVIYVKGWRRQDGTRITFAFLCLAMGMLTHYSAGPYILFFALHYLFVVLPKRPAKWRELTVIAVACGGLIATWIGWSLVNYGVKGTLASNTSLKPLGTYQGSALEKIGGNIWDSLVPHVLRDPELAHHFDQPNEIATLRDNIFIIYQVQLIFTMGLIGGPLVVWLLVRGIRRRDTPPAMRQFWLWLIGTTVVIGLAVVGERDLYGSAHLTILPMEALGLTLLASRFRTNRVLAVLLIAGCAIDFSLGVFLHLRVQHLENTADRTYFNGPSVVNGQLALVPPPDGLNDYARENWFRKHQQVNVVQWRKTLSSADVLGKPQAMAMLDDMESDDRKLFHGWYGRHGGQVEYIGDHFGASDIPSGMLAILFAGLLWRMWREIPSGVPAIAATPVKAKSARARVKR